MYLLMITEGASTFMVANVPGMCTVYFFELLDTVGDQIIRATSLNSRF